MDNRPQSKLLAGLAGLAAELNPIKSFTSVLAIGVTALAAWIWVNRSGDPRPPFPFYGTIAASYAAGFLIGRLLWRVVKTAAIVSAILLGGLVLLNRVHLDTSKAKEATEAGSAWVRSQASRAKHFLLHFLPSGGGAGVGAVAGARRRGGGDEPRKQTGQSET
jgi:hypothetical protein